MSDVTLHLGDCLEYMRGMEAGSVDIVITDPPYGIGITRNTNTFGIARDTGRRASNHSWDNKIPDKIYFDEMFRCGKNQIIFGANYFWDNFYSTQCYIIWDKRGNMPEVPFCDTEFAWTSFVNRMSKKYTVINHGFVRDSKDERTGHPTQKPTELFRQIILDFTQLNGTVFDPFMGSGTTGIACVQLGRNFIGCEIDKGYFNIAKRRIEQAQLQPALFQIDQPKAVQPEMEFAP